MERQTCDVEKVRQEEGHLLAELDLPQLQEVT
jgi:hypothetical protein